LSYIPNLLSDIVSYLTTTQFYTYLGSMFGGVKLTKENSQRIWKSSTVYPKSAFDETKIGESDRNSKIIEWLRTNEAKQPDESNNSKYYLLLLLLALGGTAWYYYGPDFKPPGLGFLWGGLEAFRNTINEIRGLNNTVRNTAATAKEFIRKPENNNFELESKDILNNVMNWHAMPVNPLNKDDLKIQWESYKIIETRISQLEQRYPDDFKIWMADRYSSVYSMRNNFWNIGPTIFDRFQNKYPLIENDTLIQQKEWSDHSSSRSICYVSWNGWIKY